MVIRAICMYVCMYVCMYIMLCMYVCLCCQPLVDTVFVAGLINFLLELEMEPVTFTW